MCLSSSVPATGVVPLAHVDTNQRLHALDILRGLALFGMILVHFHQKMRLEVTGFEDLIGWGVWIFIEQKAWGTFAFLFGVGFAVLLRRLEARRAPVTRIYLRRLATLALFGIVVEVCLGFQILFSYAAWGAALLVVRHWSTRTLLVAAVLSACTAPVIAELLALHTWWTEALPTSPGGRTLWQAVDLAARQGDYVTLLSARWALFLGTLPHTWRDVLPGVNLTLFILGLLAARHGVLDEPRRHRQLIVGWMIFGTLSWATSWLVLRQLPTMPVPGADWPLEYGFGLVQDQWLCFTYIGAVVLLLACRPTWTGRLALFGWAGRMALTNYMVQAAALDAMSSAYGLGLKLRPYRYLVAAILLFAVEAVVSRLWLTHYFFGPLEWLWRTLTYARHQPLRRRGAAIAQPTAS